MLTFDKRHSNVIEKIEELIKTENSVLTMFHKTTYKAETGYENLAKPNYCALSKIYSTHSTPPKKTILSFLSPLKRNNLYIYITKALYLGGIRLFNMTSFYRH